MKSIYSILFYLSISNFIYAQSANSSLEFMKYAPKDMFSADFNPSSLSDQFLEPKSNVFGNGFFVDGIISAGAAISAYNYHTNLPEPNAYIVSSTDIVTENSFRLGNKWYFKNNKKIQSGIQIIWARIGSLIPLGTNNQSSFFPITYKMNPLNIGSTNFIQLSEKNGLELNLNAGLTTSFAQRLGNNLNSNSAALVQFGLSVNPSVKFRLKRFSIGLDIQYIHMFPGSIYSSDGTQSTYNYDVNIILFGATIGCKF